MKKRISCIIVNYNDWKRTLELINTISDYKCISHVIVVDNCSIDDSVMQLREYFHHKYILIENQINGGYGFGNNIGIIKAKELEDEYILIANPDVKFSEQCIAHMQMLLSKIDKCAAIGAKETYLGTYGWKYTSGFHDVLSTSLFFNSVLRKRYYKAEYFLNKAWEYIDIIPGCFMLVDTNIMVEHGMYDERIFLYEEEKVIYKKFTDAGYRLAIDLGQSFEHHHVDSKLTISNCLRTKKNLIKSKRIFLKEYRHFNNIELLLSDVFFALCYIEMAVYSAIKHRG